MGEILVVDDDPRVLEATERTLRAYGYSVFPTKDPEEALAALKQNQHRFDLIILDWKLNCPIDGDMVLDLIKYKFPAFKTPILFITAHTKIASKHLIKLGACDTLSKPVTVEQLIEAVERALNKRAHEDPHRRAPAELNWQQLRKHELARKIIGAISSAPSLAEAARSLRCSPMTLNRWLRLTGIHSFVIEQERQPNRKNNGLEGESKM